MKPVLKSLSMLPVLMVVLLTFFSCNNNDNEVIIPVPDLTKNAMYIDGVKYDLTQASITYDDYYHGEHNYGLFLFSDGISFEDEEFYGLGDFIAIEFVSETWSGPTSGTYAVDDMISGVNFSVDTWMCDHFYRFEIVTLEIKKEGSIYEFTIEAEGTEYDEEQEKVIKDNIELLAHYKGATQEYAFPTKDPDACQLTNMDEVDFTFGINYDNPDLYLTSGNQSNLKDEYLEAVRAAIGTPSNDISGVLKVCNWVNQNFAYENAGGANAYIKTANNLFEEKKFYGCHTQSLIISSILRKFGFPAIMIETVDIDWAYQARDGDVDYMSGHVMSEIYVDSHWILLDNNCNYVNDYEYDNPFIPVSYMPKGLFVVGKGVDIWGYSSNNDRFTDESLWYFVENLPCYEPIFNSVNYNWTY